ncbi:MAG: Fe-S cluster assembly ATPase SufC [Candidatus Eisenbacteria bacterium]|uniref:Fe-S cluster assembly ATPase SufC n=1 Tax=Eiseniibacteriota bacterium TaxID=2212470 RepID=A0A948RTR8_UNCEI|nr:Fe-S cluster assembly ATPase SufC [Candidatus Eisenbacteria bacterium]MBU1949855.1 Fe-S cluster assembly ATPase SufC [Candidatus Eisenbacteria bacterium]MBU2690858.1 Fe-S cluster assembly ATPase SufC [Candidatus Eisenbacteria bacterium]
MIEIQNLHASIGGKEILKGIDLVIGSGEVHSIMGPNGSGKSTLAQVIAGRETYNVTAGRVILDGKNILEMSADERAREGVFMAFQYPVEIPGVSTLEFLKAAYNAKREQHGQEEADAFDFLSLVREKLAVVNMDESLLRRSVNAGFSGGEKKKHEIFQMAVLEPRFAILDETDSGLDIDALRIVSEGINLLRSPERSILLITHYQRLLDYVKPDRVHVLMDGRIIQTGGPELALELEKSGYAGIEEEAASPALGSA